MKRLLLTTALLFATAYASADTGHHGSHGKGYSFGQPGKAGDVNRTVDVTAGDDMRFTFKPPLKDIQRGETIRFRVHNTGKLTHEFSIGDAASQRAHALMMKKMPDMKHEADPGALSLAGGERGELIWTFAGSADLVFACQIPGHFDAGMKQTVQLAK
ncbi:cupredoxin domain-containing protein [Chitinolyticbacter albus]|uniref:cupredoxin domain-containing protein n=1 Tax=Chitinolyticbacter albus TaxID=2961951 RepID=UPI00210A9433|nr:cupredoxin family protein [Chitinolyticbacter albus]